MRGGETIFFYHTGISSVTQEKPFELFCQRNLTVLCFNWLIRSHCIKLTIDGNFAMNGNYHGNRAQQPIKIKVSMVVTIDGKFTINVKVLCNGPLVFLKNCIIVRGRYNYFLE